MSAHYHERESRRYLARAAHFERCGNHALAAVAGARAADHLARALELAGVAA